MKIREKYQKKIVPELKEKFGFKNDFQVPRIEKITVNSGIGKYLKDANAVKEIGETLKMISGQKPLITKAKKSVSGFKIREGLEIGFKITLRGKRKWDFLEKLVGSAIPRIRDFRGIKESAVDGRGNLNLGIKECVVFPEISPEKIKNVFSLQVSITTGAKNQKEGLELFKALGFPMEIKN